MKKYCLLLCLLVISTTGTASQEQDFTRSYALVMHGEPKLAVDFPHFAYVNPKAPKQGTLRRSASGTFDTFNPFIVKGTAAIGIGNLYDTLMVSNRDEPFSRYGLLAESVDLANDRSWVRFNLNPRARFHDGQPVTAEDVAFTFHLLLEQGAPFYKAYYGSVTSVVVESRLSVTFRFENGDNRELPLILSELVVLPKHYWQDHDFSRADLTPPLGSGPYKLGNYEVGRSVSYELVDDYWARDLPVAIGRDNIRTLIYEYYRDSSVALEAFKAGRIDFRLETSSKDWATAYRGPMFDAGKIKREEIADHTPQGMQAFVMNLRRIKFSDIRVRRALGLLFDYEWTNKNLFYGAYTRTESFFAASELAATGLPSQGELTYLNPFRSQLPPDLFTQPFAIPKTNGDGNIRPQMRRALKLLSEAGWQLREGKLTDANGEQFHIEFLLYQKNLERIVLPFINNLKRVGISCEVRLVDLSQYVNRLQSFDFDIVTGSFLQTSSPGNEQREFWGSEAAEHTGSRNLVGIKNPVVDSLIESVIHAGSRADLISAVRALDRVLLWGHYVIPQWHLASWRVAYWNKLKRPPRAPNYDLGLDTWWIEE